MKKNILNLKKSITKVLICSTILGSAIPIFATEKTTDMTINGEVQATVVSFTVPQSISFVLNPNGETSEERFISPQFTIENSSNAPIDVFISKLDNALDSSHSFINVESTKYSLDEWFKLDKTTSMKEIALGIQTLNNEEWRNSAPVNPILYAETINKSEEPINIGVLNPNSQASFKLIANHGNAFTALSSKYVSTFIFSLN